MDHAKTGSDPKNPGIKRAKVPTDTRGKLTAALQDARRKRLKERYEAAKRTREPGDKRRVAALAEALKAEGMGAHAMPLAERVENEADWEEHSKMRREMAARAFAIAGLPKPSYM